MLKPKSKPFLVSAMLSLIFIAPHPAQATVTLFDKDDWKITLGGFVEMDTIVDSTRSLIETIGNTPIDKSGTFNGSNGRTQFSIRNSRFDFGVEAPEVNGLKTRGYLEMDFLGYDNSPPAVTEAAYFNNPTLRVRHAYIETTTDTGWHFLAGQTWQLLGWQPYYFLNTVDVSPLPGQLYQRTTQIHALKKMKEGDLGMEASLGAMRPPERDSSYPSVEGGVRLTWDGRKAGFIGGATGAQIVQPASIAVSGTFREIEVPNFGGSATSGTEYPAGAIALDAMLPVLGSSDGKDVSNTLSISGEFTEGSGYGDEFVSYTGNTASPLNGATNKNSGAYALANAGTPLDLDGGIGDFDANDAFHLIHLTTFNAQFQYHFEQTTHSWISGGYAQLYSNNVDNLVGTDGNTSAGKTPYNRDQVMFANVFHEFTPQLRVGLEYDFVRTDYADGTEGRDNRYQASAWFIF